MIRPFMLLSLDEAAVMAGVLQPWAEELGLPVDAAGRVDPCALMLQFSRRQLGFTTHGAATLLQGLAAVDAWQMLQAGPARPRLRELIQTGQARYDRRDPREWWQTWRDLMLQLVRTGVIRMDCEDAGAAYAAELVVDGWDPAAAAVAYSSRPGLSHVVVKSPRYGFIDPSRLAGMGVP